MSIINYSHNFCFVHIPKTAGTSVTVALSKLTRDGDLEIGGTAHGERIQLAYYQAHRISKHSMGHELRNHVGPDRWDNMFTFSVVRHPAARLYSAYLFLRFRFRGWRNSDIMDTFANFEDFARSEFIWAPGPDRIFMPQHKWVFHEGKRVVTEVIKQEDLRNGMVSIMERIGDPNASALSVPTLNASDPRRKTDEITPAALEAIRKRYGEDLQLFDYE